MRIDDNPHESVLRALKNKRTAVIKTGKLVALLLRVDDVVSLMPRSLVSSSPFYSCRPSP